MTGCRTAEARPGTCAPSTSARLAGRAAEARLDAYAPPRARAAPVACRPGLGRRSGELYVAAVRGTPRQPRTEEADEPSGGGRRREPAGRQPRPDVLARAHVRPLALNGSTGHRHQRGPDRCGGGAGAGDRRQRPLRLDDWARPFKPERPRRRRSRRPTCSAVGAWWPSASRTSRRSAPRRAPVQRLELASTGPRSRARSWTDLKTRGVLAGGRVRPGALPFNRATKPRRQLVRSSRSSTRPRSTPASTPVTRVDDCPR